MDYYGLMMQLPRRLAVCIWLGAACASYAQTTPPASAPAAAATPPASAASAPAQSPMTARLMYELLLSELIFQRGDAQAATTFMLGAARRTHDESLFKRATEMAILSRSGPTALEATRAWRKAEPGSVEAGQYELQVLIVLGRIAETEEAVRQFIKTLPAADRVSFITALPALYQRVPSKEEAAQVVERALSEATKNPDLAPAAWTTVGRMRLQNGDKTGALSAVTLGQGADASSEWPALLALQLMAAREPQAEAIVKRYLANARAKPEVRIGYARALVEQGRNAEAHAELDQLSQQQPDNADTWLVHGALYADEHQDAQAEAALKRYLELTAKTSKAKGESSVDRDQGRNQAHMMLARIAERRGDFAAAQKLLDAVDSPEQALAVQTRRATMLAKQGKLDEARAAIRAVPEREPDDARLKLLTEAQLLRDNGEPETAYQLLNAELQNDPEDESLLYDTAMAAERANRVDEMERLLRKLIEIKPDLASAYNALGYSLADRGVRLLEAKALIEKAVQLSPEDAYIQDSLGWVEFRLGRAAEARRLLEAAYKARPDVEIATHLGEVMWSQGDREGARRIWSEAQRVDPNHETLVKTLKRLQVSP